MVLGIQAPSVFALCCLKIDLMYEWRPPCLYPNKKQKKEEMPLSFKELTWK